MKFLILFSGLVSANLILDYIKVKHAIEKGLISARNSPFEVISIVWY